MTTEAPEGTILTGPDGDKIVKKGGQWRPYVPIPSSITASEGPTPGWLRFGRQMGYEGVAGSIGGLLGSAGGPLGAAAGLGIGTGIGHIFNRLRARQAGEQVSPPMKGMLEAGQAMLMAPNFGRLGELGGAKLRQVMGPSGLGDEAAQRLARMQRAGVPPNLPAVSQKPTHRLVWEGARRYPFATEITEEYSERATKALGGRAREIAGGGGRGMFGTGRAIQEGAKGTSARFFARSGQLADNVANAVPDDVVVDLSGYRKVLEGPLRKFSANQAKAYGNTKFAQRLKALQADYGIFDEAGELVGFRPMPWKEGNAIRQVIGQELGDTGGATLQEIPVRELKAAYAAISDDLGNALTGAQKKAWNQHKTYFRRGAKVFEESIDWIRKSKKPEAFTEAIARGKYSEARRILGAVPASKRAIMREEVVYRMGLARPGGQDATGEIFSPQTFLTSYNKLDQGTRRLLFGRDKAGLKALDELAEMVGDFKAMSQVYNYSGTAGSSNIMKLAESGMGLGAVSMLFFEPTIAASLTGGALGMRKSAKLMTDPAFIKWIVKGAEFAPKSLGAAEHIARLSGLAVLESNRDAIAELQNWLTTTISETEPQ